MSRRARRLLTVTMTMVALLLLAYLGISAYVATQVTRSVRKEITRDPAALGLAAEEVSFPSATDQLTLRGWLLGGGGERLIIVVHGKDGTRASNNILEISQGLAGAGYDVLSFDMRGHGRSDGERFSLGWYERRDIHGAVEFARARGYTRIGLLGFSMGGATSLMATAENEAIQAVASDSAYADLEQLLEVQLPKNSHLPSLFNPGILAMVQLLYGPDVDKIRPADSVRQISPRPLLVMHGLDDTFIPPFNGERLRDAYNSTGAQVRYETFPGAGHVKLYESDPARYMQVLLAFFDDALGRAQERAAGS
jgi:uncharacterized protein